MIEHKTKLMQNVKSTIDTPEIKSIINVLDMAGTELPDTITDKIIYEIIEYTNKTAFYYSY